MKKICLTKGYVALVDDEDYEELSKHKWCYDGSGYAIRSTTLERGKYKRVYMHHAIIGKKEGLYVDHINGNKMDNQRKNLRHVTGSQNAQNSKSSAGASRYKGLTWHKPTHTWSVRIMVDGRRLSLRYFKSEEDAALAYNAAAVKYFGEYARLNIIIKEE